MTKKSLRVASLATALAIVLGTVAVVPAQAAEDPDLLVAYDFSSSEAGVVTDVSGNGHNASIRGTGATVAGGELRLPGGAAGSGAGYLQLPTGLFDGRNTLTISAWLKNETGPGNYVAMFFGSPSSPPAQYWLLNPQNPAGNFKSVITNGVNASQPWTTEAGIASGPATSSAYSLYTTVITPTSLTGYLNGKKIQSVATNRSVSQFGTGLVSYIGRSSYNDIFFKGAVGDVRVWTDVRTDTEIRDEFYDHADPAAIDAVLKADADSIDLGDPLISADLSLPNTAPGGSDITWASSNTAVIANDGTVTRPTGADATVTLTATLTLRGRTTERAFELTVAAQGAQRDVELIAARYKLGITHVFADIVLPTTAEGASVSWASSKPAVISSSGAVTRASTDVPVTLTATFTRDGASTSRAFDVTVLEGDTAQLGGYIVGGNTDRTDVLHLATSADGATFTAVNNGRGVLYPTLSSRKLGNPELFRTPGGDFKLLAPVDSSSTQMFLFDTTDLVTYTGERLVTLPMAATRTQVAYDNGILAYRIRFTAAAGGTYETTTADWVTFTAPKTVATAVSPTTGTFPAGALEQTSIPVTDDEIALVKERLSRVVSTGVREFAPVTTDEGTAPTLPTAATVEYSSGSTTKMKVQWDADDVAAVDAAGPGTYTVDGTVVRPTYPNPLVERRADPDVTLGDDGWYYFTASYPTVSNSDPEGYDRIILRRARTIEGLKTAAEVVIWDEAVDPVLNRYIWAPELTKIGNDWYILFTAGRDPFNGFDIRPAMLKFTGAQFGGTAALDAANWKSLGQVKAQPGDVTFTAFSLDMTHLEAAGRHYVTWAQYFNDGVTNDSRLFMAEIDPANPIQLLTPALLLSSPKFAWEKPVGADWGIDEGPAFIKHDGKVILSFSAATVDDKYAVGLMYADENADPLDLKSWTKVQYPVLSSADFTDQVGPGHNSFTIDELGNPVIVYHARTPNDTTVPGEASDLGLNDPRRHARAKTVHWDSQGLPIFNMTAAEELRPDLERVKIQVVVKDVPSAVSVTAVATTRCVSGKVTLTVKVTNTSDVTVETNTATSWGSKTTTALAPGKSTSAAFSTRATTIPSGSAQVTATAVVAGKTQSVTVPADYVDTICR